MYVKHYSSSWNIVWEPKGISVCEFSTGFLKECIFEALKWVYNFKNCTSSNLSSLCSISLQSSGSSMISSSSEVYQNIKIGCWFRYIDIKFNSNTQFQYSSFYKSNILLFLVCFHMCFPISFVATCCSTTTNTKSKWCNFGYTKKWWIWAL